MRCKEECNHAFCMEFQSNKELEANLRKMEESLENIPVTMPWKESIQIISSPEAYLYILVVMFEDNVYNERRLQIISFLTTDLCNVYPEIATEIQVIYLAFMASIAHSCVIPGEEEETENEDGWWPFSIFPCVDQPEVQVWEPIRYTPLSSSIWGPILLK